MADRVKPMYEVEGPYGRMVDLSAIQLLEEKRHLFGLKKKIKEGKKIVLKKKTINKLARVL
ncbi:MAG: hypothetical protein M1448_03845 [Candidatus Marsarchaeota archaeon]|jgi:hypothetical protein|nr:hypothetical protein [Candidatus Marsarchaeota archaeon]